MLLRDAAAMRDINHETLVLETAPPGINIFSLLNLPAPGNVTDFEGWKIIFSSNSSSYSNISSVLQVRNNVYCKLGQVGVAARARARGLRSCILRRVELKSNHESLNG